MDNARPPVVFHSSAADGDILTVVDVQSCFSKVAKEKRRRGEEGGGEDGEEGGGRREEG